jgi:hypothetical protein
LKFWISTYSVGLLTATIKTVPLFVAVAGGTVTVGSRVGNDVSDAIGIIGVGETCVGVWVWVGRAVSVGRAVEVGKVGNGAKVTVPKLNSAVGVGPTA